MMKKLFAVFLVVCFQSSLSNAGCFLGDGADMSQIPDGAYLKLMQQIVIPSGDRIVAFFEGKIVPTSHLPPLDSLSATCFLAVRETSTNIRVVPSTVEGQCACVVLKAGQIGTSLNTSSSREVTSRNSYIKESCNFHSFICYKENGTAVTVGEMKAAIDGFLEFHVPPHPVVRSPENFKIPKNSTSGTPSKASGCCTLL